MKASEIPRMRSTNPGGEGKSFSEKCLRLRLRLQNMHAHGGWREDVYKIYYIYILIYIIKKYEHLCGVDDGCAKSVSVIVIVSGHVQVGVRLELHFMVHICNRFVTYMQ